MPKRILLKALLTITLFIGAQFAIAAEFYSTVFSSTYSEPVSISVALKEWEGKDFKSGTQQWSFHSLESGLERNGHRYGLIHRRSYDLKFSQDLAELYWLQQNDRELTPDKQYQTNLDVFSFQADGFRYTFSEQKKANLTYQMGLGIFKAHHLIDGSIYGSASATSVKEYDIDLDLDYQYSEDLVFERKVARPQGRGISLDWRSTFILSKKTKLHTRIIDMFALIRWKSLPYTQGKASSARKHYNDNGFVIFDPILQGWERTHKTQNVYLKPKLENSFGYQASPTSNIFYTNQYMFHKMLHTLGAGLKPVKGANTYTLQYQLETNMLGLGFRRKRFHINISTDALPKDQSRYFDLKFSWNR